MVHPADKYPEPKNDFTFRKNDEVTHVDHPEWGVGTVEVAAISYCKVYFRDRGEQRLTMCDVDNLRSA